MKYFALLFFMVCTTSVCNSALANIDAKIIPNEKIHKIHLYNQYEPKKQNLIVFKDPFCPYCIKGIERLKLLSEYNVFVFWAPILGTNSERRVNSFFHCEHVASSLVLGSVKARLPANCKGELNEKNLQENLRIVDNYHVNSVPSYYLQGREFSFNQLLELNPHNPSINGVVLDWSRYEMMQSKPRSQSKYLALAVPIEQDIKWSTLVDQYNPQYLFFVGVDKKSNSLTLACQQLITCNEQNKLTYLKKTLEFNLLLGSSFSSTGPTLVDFSGNTKTL